MLATRRTQSVSDFRQKAAETLERLNKTGEAEILTVNGEARAVLVSPAEYDEYARDREMREIVRDLQLSKKQVAEGKFSEISEFHKEMRRALLSMKRKGKKR